MSNLFEALALPVSLSMSRDEIDDAWRKLSQESHPDLVGEMGVDISAKINQAREILSKPAGRLQEWLKVKSGETPSQNTSLSEDLITLFSKVGDILLEADSTIGALNKSQTALAKSLLMPRAIAAQLAIQKQLGEITAKIEGISQNFPAFEASENFPTAKAALGKLKFLDKWQRECQQRLLELIAID